jgi:hypothetical protein
MAKRFFVDADRVGIVLENGLTGLKEPSGTYNLNHSNYMGGLYCPTDKTYRAFTVALSASIESIESVYETFQHLGDNFDHSLEIRANGSGSVKIYLIDDDTTETSGTIVDAFNLLYAYKNFPFGVTNTSISTDAEYNALDDLTNAGVIANDKRGYAIIVELKTAGADRYKQIVFHNARIEVTIDQIQPGKATQATLKWSDARYVQVLQATSAFTDHSDS